MIRNVIPVLAAVGLSAAAARADVADVAELFPEGTLAYAEVRNPADAAKVKPVRNPTTIAKLRERAKKP